MANKKKTVPTSIPTMSAQVFETSPIRLSADETRLIVKVANNRGKPVCDYRAHGLVEMGILSVHQQPVEDHSKELETLWGNLYNFVGAKRLAEAQKCLVKIQELSAPRGKKPDRFVLTELGKQIARGISVKLSGQYTPKGC